MSDTDRSTMSCANIQAALRQPRALTAAESAHIERCDECLEAWLDATVTGALDAKPEVRIPADFAARVATQLPAGRSSALRPPRRSRQWGLLTAALLVIAGLLAAALADPSGLKTRMGVIFLLLVASEVAAIALWLGTGRSGQRLFR